MICLLSDKQLRAPFHYPFLPGNSHSNNQSCAFPAFRNHPIVSRWGEDPRCRSTASCSSFRRSFRAMDFRRPATFLPSVQKEFRLLLSGKNQGNYVHNQNIPQTTTDSNRGNVPCTNSRCCSSHRIYHIDWQNGDQLF